MSQMSRHITTDQSGQQTGVTGSLPGLAAEILRLIPVALLLGTVLIAVPSIVARFNLWPVIVGTKHIGALDTLALGLLFSHWVFLLAAAIGAFMVAHVRSLERRAEAQYADGVGKPTDEP
jgi:hypothetical protein